MNIQTATAATTGGRVTAIDVMRGLTIVCMIIVNNGVGESYMQLQHSEWNGLTVCDLVFPFFLFIMGMTTYLSMSRAAFKVSAATVAKILRRSVVILLISWGIHWLDNVYSGRGLLDFGHLRLTGVLTRIALCYAVVALMSLWLSLRGMVIAAVVLLGVYGTLLLAFDGFVNSHENINAIVDRFILPDGHLYTKRPVDPEGILATLSAVSHTIIGFCCGAVVKARMSLESGIVRLFVIGTLLMMAGVVLTWVFPINKRVWSPSYVLVTCGMASTLLATLSWFIDAKGYRRPFRIFEAYGVNPLFLYVLAEVFGILLGVRFLAGDASVKNEAYAALCQIIPDPSVASLVYALSLTAVLSAFAIPLYRRHVYIKI